MLTIRREKWKDLYEFDGYYSVSNMGRVRSNERDVPMRDGRTRHVKERILRPGITKGYLFVNLRYEGNSYTREIHRLVGDAFLDTVHGKTQIGHIRLPFTNNEVSNLKYTTDSERMKLCYSRGRIVHPTLGKFGGDNPRALVTYCYEMNGEFKKCFNSIIEAAEWIIESGKSKASTISVLSAIARARRGEYSHSYGYLWRGEAPSEDNDWKPLNINPF